MQHTFNSPAYNKISGGNLNKPLSQLICPQCESIDVERDKEGSDHPGQFACVTCNHTFLA